MGTTFIADGNSVNYIPSSAVVAGDVVVQGELVGVATVDIAADALGALAVAGVFLFPKAGNDDTLVIGVEAYWDVADQLATSVADSGTNKLIGKVVLEAAETDTTVRIRLDQ